MQLRKRGLLHGKEEAKVYYAKGYPRICHFDVDLVSSWCLHHIVPSDDGLMHFSERLSQKL